MNVNEYLVYIQHYNKRFVCTVSFISHNNLMWLRDHYYISLTDEKTEVQSDLVI